MIVIVTYMYNVHVLVGIITNHVFLYCTLLYMHVQYIHVDEYLST